MRAYPLLALPLLATLACSSSSSPETDDGAFSSNQATLLNFEFDGEFVTDTAYGTDESIIEDQLLFTIGELNGSRAVGRLDAVTLSKVTRTREGTNTRIKYHAVLPVGWGSKTSLPKSYEFHLPNDLTTKARNAFTEKYKHDCVESGAHDVDTSSLWYYYRPSLDSCAIDEAELTTSTVKVTKSKLNTSGKYPEFDKIWEDDSFNVVAVFGKYEKGTTSDVGISGYNNFINAAKEELKAYRTETTPKSLPVSAGVANPDVEIRATLGDGRTIRINALLVDEVSTADRKFFSRYEALSTDADLITYNGHAGLGQNVRALSAHGKFKKGKYAIVFMNGCDTFAYVDGSLADARARLNPDDPTGTKYLDFVTNVMPAYFSSMPTASMALVHALADKDSPRTYDEIFQDVAANQIVVVTGEEDNTFTP